MIDIPNPLKGERDSYKCYRELLFPTREYRVNDTRILIGNYEVCVPTTTDRSWFVRGNWKNTEFSSIILHHGHEEPWDKAYCEFIIYQKDEELRKNILDRMTLAERNKLPELTLKQLLEWLPINVLREGNAKAIPTFYDSWQFRTGAENYLNIMKWFHQLK